MGNVLNGDVVLLPHAALFSSQTPTFRLKRIRSVPHYPCNRTARRIVFQTKAHVQWHPAARHQFFGRVNPTDLQPVRTGFQHRPLMAVQQQWTFAVWKFPLWWKIPLGFAEIGLSQPGIRFIPVYR